MSAAHAADVVQPVEASGFNWGGAYVGIGGGFGASVHKFSVAPVVDFNGIGGNGVFGELTAGYDYMVSERFLLGGFIDANGGNIGPSISVPGADIDLTNSYGFDVGLRAGYLLNPNTLGYVLGGYSWQHFKLDGSGDADGLSFTENRGGYVLGVGMETVLRGNWTLKTEYRYADYGDKSVLHVGDTSLNVEPSTHTFHIAANYRFGAQNGGGASFAAPAYNWTGFYVGGALGAGTAVHDIGLDLGASADLNGIGSEGVFGEASVGYDQDFGSWVAGVQFDGRYSGIRSKLDIFGGSIKGDADYGFDALARVGAKVNDSTLAYVIGGYSWQHFNLHASAPGGPSGDIYDWGSSGFSVGGGLETAISSNTTVGLEYRYSQYQKEDFGSGGLLEDTPSFQTVRVGAKYKFN